MNIRELPDKEMLTTESSGHRLGGGDIFMSTDNSEGVVEQQPATEPQPVTKPLVPPPATGAETAEQADTNAAKLKAEADVAAAKARSDEQFAEAEAEKALKDILDSLTPKNRKALIEEYQKKLHQARNQAEADAAGDGEQPPEEPPTTTEGGNGGQPPFRDPELLRIIERIEKRKQKPFYQDLLREQINLIQRFRKGEVDPDEASRLEDSLAQELDDMEEAQAQSQAGEGGAGRGGERKPPTASGSSYEEPEEPEPTVNDAKAKELIDRFKLEKGENNPRKIQQLRESLARRIWDLEKEQAVEGTREGARVGVADEKITEANKLTMGALTPEAAAKIDQIENKIQEIREMQAFILAKFFVPEESQGGEDRRDYELVKKTNEFVAKLLSKARPEGILNRGQINDMSKLNNDEKKERKELVEEIEAFIKESFAIDTQQFPVRILLAVRNFTELREELISEILFKSFEDPSETNHYDVGLYAASNLDTLLGFLTQDDNKRYKELFTLRTAAQFFQTMNSTVIIGKFDHFGDAAENINYQHFENMRDIGASGLAMRLYEDAYKKVLAKNKNVMQDKIEWIHAFVEKTLKDDNEAGLVKSPYAQYRENDPKMKEWEIRRALAAGRTFFNITLRAVENIAIGQVPTDRKKLSSEPQEDMVRILNWKEWLLMKFGPGDTRHGLEFLDMVTKKFQEYLKHKGAKLGKNKIVEFGGVNVLKLEDAGQFRASGVYSGWRLENMAFDEIYLIDKNGKMIRDEKRVPQSKDHLRDVDGVPFMTVQGYRDQEAKNGQPDIKGKIKAMRDAIEAGIKANPDKKPADLVSKAEQMEYRDLLKPVIDNLDFGLSMLLKNGDFGRQDDKLGYLLREEIWKKVSQTNMPLMIDYLSNVQYEWTGKLLEVNKKLDELNKKRKQTNPTDKAEIDKLDKEIKKEEKEKTKWGKMREKAAEEGLLESKSLEQIKKEFVPDWTEKKWEDFERKVMISHERMIKKGMGEKLPVELEKNIFTLQEKELLKQIKIEGMKLAPHLADIVFPYTPFMNDMPFEKFQYKYAGQTFYKRRTTGDLGGFNKGQQAFQKLMMNPGGIPVKDLVEIMKEIVGGIEGPEGPKPAMEANLPNFSALLDIVLTVPWMRQAVFKMLLEMTHHETSLAEKWAGIKADSINEAEGANLIDETFRLGLLSADLARYFKKEKHLGLRYILWMLIRDIVTLVPAYAGSELIGAVKGK